MIITHIGLMLDETCDISIEKKLAIYTRYVNSETDSVKGYSTPYFDFCSKCSICTIKTYDRQKEREYTV